MPGPKLIVGEPVARRDPFEVNAANCREADGQWIDLVRAKVLDMEIERRYGNS